MSVCIEKLPHKECGSNKGLQVFANEETGKVTGYCFSCATFVKNPYGEEMDIKDVEVVVKSPEQIRQEISEISNLKAMDLPTRKLKASSLDFFGIKVGLSERDGKTPAYLYYPYYKKGEIVGYKCKILETKTIFSIGDTKGADLFGWGEAISTSSGRLVITEGEDDAAAIKQMYEKFTKNEHKQYIPGIVSLPRGAANAKNVIQDVLAEINNRFKEVVLCFDDDEAGHKAVKEVSLILPTATSVTLPRKDANQCIIDGVARAAYNQIHWNSKVNKNTRLIFAKDLHEEAGEPPKWGDLSWPWDHVNNVTRGIRWGEVTYIGAGVKMGKSELVNALAAHFIKKHKIKIFMAKPEEAVKKTYKLIAGKLVGKRFHDPKVEFDREAYDRAGKIMGDYVSMIDLYQKLPWDGLKQDIYDAVAWGAKVVFIDPITNLTDGINSGDANTKLQEIALELSAMAKDLNIHVFVFCHLKAHEGNITKDKREKEYGKGKFLGLGNCPHEYGGDVYSNQFRGSRAMMQKCNYMFALEGNKDPDIPIEQKNIRSLKLLEDREFGECGDFRLHWNDKTTQFSEI